LRFAALILPLLFCTSLLSQNLVRNGSFEEYLGKIEEGISEISKVKNWEDSHWSSDYYHTGTKSIYFYRDDTPCNYFACQKPKPGQAYAGFALNNVEFLQTKLSERLKEGKFYFIRYYVNLSDSASHVSKSINAYLLDKPLLSNGKVKTKCKICSSSNKYN
jgi:hypothetical protein